ncbi:MAG: hypothetical protein GXX96_24825 [Planctomycetaceae bacterium]|nr:hypothetical protein [Planctomycetaceae bacterium]
MIDKFLRSIGFGSVRVRRSSTNRSADHLERRLAVEPIEDRLLLSVTGADPVSDGGTIVLGGFSGVSFSSCDGMIVAPSGVSGSGSTAVQSPSSDRSDLPKPYSTGRPDLAGSREALGRQAAPSPQRVAPDDLVSTPRDQGMVDVTHAAYDQVFAELGSPRADLAVHRSLGLQPGLLTTAEDMLASAARSSAAPSHDTLNSLNGSRGRLTAFDLAIEQETAYDARADVDDFRSSEPPGRESVPSPEAASPMVVPGLPAAFSSIEPQPGTAPPGGGDDSARGLSPNELFAVSDGFPETHARLGASSVLPGPLQKYSHFSPIEPATEDVLRNAAVCLDQKRDTSLVHLAVAVGISQVLTGRHRRSGEEPEHEQRPPRRRP